MALYFIYSAFFFLAKHDMKLVNVFLVLMLTVVNVIAFHYIYSITVMMIIFKYQHFTLS